MCALLLPGNISPLRSQIVLPSVLSVSSVLILLKKSSQQTIKTLDLTLHHSSSPLDSWYPFSQIWYYELETVLVSSCEIKNTLFLNNKVSHFHSRISPSIFWGVIIIQNLFGHLIKLFEARFARKVVKRDFRCQFSNTVSCEQGVFWLYYVKNCTTLLLWQPWQHQDMKSLFRPNSYAAMLVWTIFG